MARDQAEAMEEGRIFSDMESNENSVAVLLYYEQLKPKTLTPTRKMRIQADENLTNIQKTHLIAYMKSKALFPLNHLIVAISKKQRLNNHRAKIIHHNQEMSNLYDEIMEEQDEKLEQMQQQAERQSRRLEEMQQQAERQERRLEQLQEQNERQQGQIHEEQVRLEERDLTILNLRNELQEEQQLRRADRHNIIIMRQTIQAATDAYVNQGITMRNLRALLQQGVAHELEDLDEL